MSNITTPPVITGNKASAPGSVSSAWARGPPSATPSNAASNNPSGANTPSQGVPALPNGMNASGTPGAANGPAPIPIGGGHSRKNSLLVGAGGMDIKKGNIAFGTVDHPNSMLSSSPAAPSTTGGHLADSVKSFGTIDADASSDPNVVKTRRVSNLAPAGVAQQQQQGKSAINIHQLFGGKRPSQSGPSGAPPPVISPPPHQSPNIHHIRRQSMGQSGGFQGLPSGLPNSPYSGVGHVRPPVNGLPNQPRSPMVNQNIGPGQFNSSVPPHIQQGFRPPQGGMAPQQQQPGRPNGVPPQGGPRPMMNQGMPGYGMHPAPQGPPFMGYPPPNQFYPNYNAYEQQGFAPPPQWAHQQYPQGQPPYTPNFAPPPVTNALSPRMAQGQLSHPPVNQSPMPPTSATPPNPDATSPVPTPPSRPSSLMTGHQATPSNASIASVPPTPARPISAAPPYLSGSASSFTPRRATAAIKFSRPDGTAVDIKEAAKAAGTKGSFAAGSAGALTPETTGTGEAAAASPAAQAEAPKKKIPSLPVVVRMESEDQRKARLAEEAEKERIREIERKEEEERKARQERKAKEEEERKEREAKEAAEKAEKEKAAAEEKAKADADAEKKRLDDAFAAEQEEAKKVAAEKEAAVKLAATRDAQAEQEKAAAHTALQEARDKAEEQRRALLTPATSTSGTPIGSPALGAGLPAKPVAAITSAKRVAPSALDLKASSPSLSNDVPTASISALGSARPIDDLASINYPSTLKSPNPQLNVGAEPGKFRYDRDFLMQFMNVCREKPESLPPLEEIGLEAAGDGGSGFGGRGSRGGRASQGPSSRNVSGAPAGLGIGGLNRPFPGQGMGSFGMGQFGSGTPSLRGSSSEQRYRGSISGRTPSQGGPGGLPSMSGLPSMGQSASRTGGNRGSQRGARRAPQDPRASQEPAPVIAVSENAWTRGRMGGDSESSPVFIERKVKALLNKLTEEKFDSISKQILEWANKSEKETDGMTLKLVIKLIFEKATDEAHWSAMYAKLCRLILTELNPAVTEVIDGDTLSGGRLFRKYLLGRCQMDFESGWKAREDTAVAAAAKQEEDKERLAKHEEEKGAGGETGEAAMLSDEYYAAQKAKRRGLGLIQLIGELYKMSMVSKGVIQNCLVKLLGNVTSPDEEDIESACKLLTTIGATFNKASPESMANIMERLSQISKIESLPSRIRFMILDVIELRANGWTSRNKQAGVMTIAEIHQQAAQDKAASAAHAARESISRGGSRAGRDRRDAPQPGEWQVSGGGNQRSVSRPTDFSGVGRNISSSGSGPSFGPTSVFSRTRRAPPGGPAGGIATPPISRQPSSANMFSALNDAHEVPESPVGRRSSADAGEPAAAPQRKRLNLAPRTKPIATEGEGNAEEEDEHDSEEEGEVAEDEMSEEAAKTKINSDMKELWGEKDQGGSRNAGDIVDYFAGLPEARRPLLAERLLDDVFRIAKPKDAEVVARGWKAALEKDVGKAEMFKQTLERRIPTLDDEAIDFPAAYTAVGLLIRVLALSPEEIEALGSKIDVDGEPRVTPKMKLEKALVKVDEEAVLA
ncbi:hypothetical protein IAT38_002942 [Cryptococcus sp. DSM 104549]